MTPCCVWTDDTTATRAFPRPARLQLRRRRLPMRSPQRRRCARARAPAGTDDCAASARRQAHHQRQDRRQPAGAVQVQMGVGEIPRRLRQPLDAAGSQHEPRHRALEGSERPDRGRAAARQAQPRLLRHRRFARREQHRARHLPPHHRARMPPVPAAPGVRGGDPYPRLPVHRREPGPGRGRGVQRLPRDRVASATRTSS